MSEMHIKQFIRQEYGLNGNTKIRKIDLTKQEFELKIGECMATIPFGKRLKRELKLEKIGI